MLVSPAEPKSFYQLGSVSSLPEKYGCDFFFPHGKYGKVGIQRKTLNDLVASLQDGRVAKELGQMRQLDLGIWLLEGDAKWTSDGQLYGCRITYSKSSHRGVILRLQSSGYWILTSSSLEESIELLSSLPMMLERESSLSRPKPTSAWGTRSNRDWAIHLLTSFEGIGPKVAGKIYDKFGVPLAWKVTEAELLSVEGVGKGRAKKLVEALNSTTLNM